LRFTITIAASTHYNGTGKITTIITTRNLVIANRLRISCADKVTTQQAPTTISRLTA